MTEKDPKKVTAWRQVGLLSSIPFILALAPIIGFLLGLGFIAGVRETINIVKLAQRED